VPRRQRHRLQDVATICREELQDDFATSPPCKPSEVSFSHFLVRCGTRIASSRESAPGIPSENLTKLNFSFAFQMRQQAMVITIPRKGPCQDSAASVHCSLSLSTQILPNSNQYQRKTCLSHQTSTSLGSAPSSRQH
jgi:hypothetical protein